MSIDLYIGLVVLATATGMYGAFLYGKRVSGFRIHKYFLTLLVPMIGLVGLVSIFGTSILYFYVASCILGFVLEGLYGWVYYRTQGERFWKYYRYTIGGHTSFLTPPLWGFAGIVFFLLSYFFGL